jgi:hypothetical protein
VRGAIEHDRLDVYVPRAGRISVILPALLPRAAYDWVGRLLHVDSMFAHVDTQKRAAYLKRTTEAPRDGEPSFAGQPRGLPS